MSEAVPLSSILEAFSILDFPLVILSADGTTKAASRGARELVPVLSQNNHLPFFPELLPQPPADFAQWLKDAQMPFPVVLAGGGSEAPGGQLLVKSEPLKGVGTGEDLWVLHFHQDESFSRQKYEREILLKISSVPIPEMTAEGIPLCLEKPNAGPRTRGLMESVLRYIGGDAALLFRAGEGKDLELIGQAGWKEENLTALLNDFQNPEVEVIPPMGILTSSVEEGLSLILTSAPTLPPEWVPLLRHLGVSPVEFWVDGIPGFGVTVTFFNTKPNQATRQFASDAYLRLGRHLESGRYSNNMYEAYLELQQTQEQMIQSGKMAAIGELATGMAHELKQPLTAINNFLSNLFEHLEKGDFEKISLKLEEYRTRSRRNMDRLTGIIDHLRTFGRMDSLRFSPVELKDFLDEIFATFLEAQLSRENVTTHFDLPADLPLVEMDTPRMEQVVLNLISNARHALENTPNPEIYLKARVKGDTLIFTIGDNGPGIPKDVLDKVQDPFFTTKPVGKGTGVGLSVSHGIMKSHNGELSPGNREEGGALFTIELPLTHKKTTSTSS